jgi:hypothetical protein
MDQPTESITAGVHEVMRRSMKNPHGLEPVSGPGGLVDLNDLRNRRSASQPRDLQGK